MTWLAGIPVSGMVKMYSIAASAGCCLIVCGTNVEDALELCESIC